jgi:hypothetical protein
MRVSESEQGAALRSRHPAPRGLQRGDDSSAGDNRAAMQSDRLTSGRAMHVHLLSGRQHPPREASRRRIPVNAAHLASRRGLVGVVGRTATGSSPPIDLRVRTMTPTGGRALAL